MNLKPDQIERFSAISRTMGNPIRLQIIAFVIARGPINVKAVQTQFGLPQSNMSHHLNLMYQSGIIEKERRGKSMMYFVAADSMARKFVAFAQDLK